MGTVGSEPLPFLSLLRNSRPSKSIHILTLFGVVLGLGGGQTLGRGLGRERQLFLQLALIRLQSPSPPPPPCWEATALSQHYCDSHEPIAHNPSTLGHPDLWL
uniref:Macaca fascicularis brain cDNA clone: QbsB-10348, similar to human RAB5C, member RAS oncogene family (RAB5C), transcriptvariant 1, mRNA, RefSeq: NM_201434.1 n=1 Tax=Macaca fascicularis TaxID=9541 RepID=I7GHY5_MACFA|nr:unnamed protein product [Macaca fascicularis]